MFGRNLGHPKQIKITPSEDKKLFRFLVSFPEPSKLPVEIEITAEGTMALMKALQDLQVRHQIPIPANLRPSGPPRLVIVSPED
jgi:hypothetical protein